MAHRRQTARATSGAESKPRAYRHKIRNLTYLDVDANRGLLRDLNEFGVASQTLAPVQVDQPVRLNLDLRDPRLRVDAQGRVVWTDGRGQAGVEFVKLPQSSRRAIQEWIFAQLLAAAYRALGDENAALLFSSIARPAIRLKQPIGTPVRLLRFAGINFTASTFAGIVDGLVMLCAILLFSVLTLALTDILPSWPVACALILAATTVFVLAYWGLFGFFFGSTPGERLAEMACREAAANSETMTRFR